MAAKGLQYLQIAIWDQMDLRSLYLNPSQHRCQPS
jgi:hypothetical protein